jgi:hypothetical protein
VWWAVVLGRIVVLGGILGLGRWRHKLQIFCEYGIAELCEVISTHDVVVVVVVAPERLQHLANHKRGANMLLSPSHFPTLCLRSHVFVSISSFGFRERYTSLNVPHDISMIGRSQRRPCDLHAANRSVGNQAAYQLAVRIRGMFIVA